MKTENKMFWIFALSSAIYFTQGIEGLPGLALFFYLKEKLGFSADKIMYISSVTGLAWLIKPIWGYLADNYFTQKRWILISLVGSILISLYFGLSPILPLGMLILMSAIGSWTAAMRDTSVDGIMCVSGKENDECDRIQAIQWTSITIASIIVGLIGGYIADHFNYKVGYLCLIPIYLLIIAIVLKYRTTVSKNRTCCECHFALECPGQEKICKSFRLRKVEKKVHIVETICSYKELFTNKQFLLGCLFILVYNFAPGFGTPLMFIERDTFKWSGTFMGGIGALSSGLSILGAIVYFKFSKRINVKKCLFWSVFIVGLTNLAYLYFTPVSAIIYSFIFGILGMFIFLNMMTFMAKSTLPGKEATSFALLCSVSNLSGTLSTLAGAWLFPILGLKCIIIVASLSAFVSLPILNRLQIKEE
jgi:predicted MFS family arabinose efflux permease